MSPDCGLGLVPAVGVECRGGGGARNRSTGSTTAPARSTVADSTPGGMITRCTQTLVIDAAR